MKRLFTLLLCVFMLMPMFCACGNEEASAGITVGDYSAKIGSINALSGVSLLDKSYSDGGKLSVTYVSPSDGTEVKFYRTSKDGALLSIAEYRSKGDTCLIPTNGCSVFIPGKELSGSATLDYELSPDGFTDLENSACITDESGLTGFAISHRNPISLDGVANALFESGSGVGTEIPSGALGISFFHRSKDTFKTMEYGISAVRREEYSLIITDEYALAFADELMKEGSVYMMKNTEKVDMLGSETGLKIGEAAFAVAEVDPLEPCDGVCVYDRGCGLALSPEREGDFIDLLVFENRVTLIGEKNQRLIMPCPNGYLVSFNGISEVERAKSINVGDSAAEILFSADCTPKKYALLPDGKAIETEYFDQSRTAAAGTVIYDGSYVYNSTKTNMWGVEVAVGSDGKVISVTNHSTDVSGDADIPEGGFVISSVDEEDKKSLLGLKTGDSVSLLDEDGMYFCRVLENAVFGSIPEEEHLSVISEGMFTPIASNVLELCVDQNGFIVSSADSGRSRIPENGFVISATGEKKTELARFFEIGQRVFADEENNKICLFGSAEVKTEKYETLLADTEKTVSEALSNDLPLDYKAIYSLIASAKESLSEAKTDPKKYIEAFADIDSLRNMCVPSLAVRDRSAWVVCLDEDAADVKHTVAYAKSLGLNTLILSPYRDTYAMYDSRNEHLLRSPTLASGVDILGLYVDECHSAGLSLIFMYCCFGSAKPSDSYPQKHYVN